MPHAIQTLQTGCKATTLRNATPVAPTIHPLPHRAQGVAPGRPARRKTMTHEPRSTASATARPSRAGWLTLDPVCAHFTAQLAAPARRRAGGHRQGSSQHYARPRRLPTASAASRTRQASAEVHILTYEAAGAACGPHPPVYCQPLPMKARRTDASCSQHARGGEARGRSWHGNGTPRFRPARLAGAKQPWRQRGRFQGGPDSCRADACQGLASRFGPLGAAAQMTPLHLRPLRYSLFPYLPARPPLLRQ